LSNFIETSVDRVQGDDYCVVYTMEKKFIDSIKQYAKDYPQEVVIRKEQTGFGAYIEVELPYRWFKFPKPPRKVLFTPEQLEAKRQIMANARAKRGNPDG